MGTELKIEVVRWFAQARRDLEAYPRLVLEIGRPWFDWPSPDPASRHEGFQTLFDVFFQERPEEAPPRSLGSVKILQRGRRSLSIIGPVAHLPEDCCSLGQTVDYYRRIEGLGAATAEAILAALRDVTAHPMIARSFEEEAGFRESLLRFPEAERMFRERSGSPRVGSALEQSLVFRFSARLEGFEQPHEIDLDFRREPASLGRLIAVIGRNGTGNTQLLARLACALWGLRGANERLHPGRPSTGRVIAVSYSALDVFERPPHFFQGRKGRPAFDNYCYCGFRDADDTLRPSALFELLGQDLEEIARLGRRSTWVEMLEELRLLEEEPHLAEAFRTDDEAFVEAARKLAAGQKTALSVLTRILARIRDRSFLLIDEPEQNLHPRLLAATLRVLHGWLDTFDSFGVLATHSPVVLQEIPGRCVRVLDRMGNVPFFRPYESESFGQNLSEITASVFGLDERDQNYALVLEKLLSSGMSPSDIEAAFGRTLSMSARMALRALAERRRS